MVLLHLVALLIGALGPTDGEVPDLGGGTCVQTAASAGGVSAETYGSEGREVGGGLNVRFGQAVVEPGLQDSTGVAVLVHQEPGTGDLEASQIRRVFLLRQRFWSDGTPVAPVNLPASSPLRETFSRLVLGQSTRDLAEYWKDLYFHGTQPPPVLDSEEAVLLYVARTRGGIGYVSLAFLNDHALPAEVRVAEEWVEGE